MRRLIGDTLITKPATDHPDDARLIALLRLIQENTDWGRPNRAWEEEALELARANGWKVQDASHIAAFGFTPPSQGVVRRR